MKNNTILRIGAGAAFVALGGILLSESFGVQFHYWREFWYGLCAFGFIMVGVLTLRNRNWLWGALWVAVGLTIGTNAFLHNNVNIWRMFLPLVLIAIGLTIIFNLSQRQRRIAKQSSDDNMVASFSGNTRKIKGEFVGNSLSAAFGQVDLDLRQAKIEDGAVIDIFVVCGGINIIFPDNVIVKTQVNSIFGGVEDKTNAAKSAKKTVYIRGDCVLGGLEIK
ncbi:hypothetical protein HG437_000655 [Candidatus Saccharibacteria bacterium]|nr:hypothetical protein [Candidatus Saccharibacteria bacterium]